MTSANSIFASFWCGQTASRKTTTSLSRGKSPDKLSRFSKPASSSGHAMPNQASPLIEAATRAMHTGIQDAPVKEESATKLIANMRAKQLSFQIYDIVLLYICGFHRLTCDNICHGPWDTTRCVSRQLCMHAGIRKARPTWHKSIS